MTKDEALKLALEALEANYLLVNGTETHGGLEQCLDGYYSGCFDTDPINKQTEEAITAIKEALAKPEQEPVKLVSYNCKCGRTMNFESVHGVVAPQRKPLTDEEIMNIAKVSCSGISPHEDTLNFAKVIEAVHGIKE